jgi:hypothetical protein
MCEERAMRCWRRVSSAVLIGLFALGAVAPAALGAPGPCEKALAACLLQPGNNLPWNIIACLQGYDFCKRFVEPLLARDI